MKLNLFLSNRVRNILFTASVSLAILPAGVGAFQPPLWMQGGHAARISGLASSPDGNMIASSSEDGTVKLWSTNGTLLRTLNTQPYPTTAVAWSPDGLKIAAGSYYGGYVISKAGAGLTYLWQATSGTQSAWTSGTISQRLSTNLFGKVTALAFWPDSSKLASGNAAGSNFITKVSDGSYVAASAAYNTSVRPAALTSVAFSSWGWMASGCEDATIRVYDGSWTQKWSSTTAHTTNVTAVAFSSDALYLATASLDQTVKIWSSLDWTPQQTNNNYSGVTSVAFSPDGAKLVTGCMDGTVRLWDSSGNCLVTNAAHALPVTATIFSTDGSLVISSSDDGTIRLWSAADGSAVRTLGGQNSFIGAVAISPDGTLCASAGGNESIQVRKTSDGSLVQTLAANTNFVSSLAFSPDSARLASGGGPLDPAIKIWRISSGALLNTIAATANGVMALAWSPDGSTLASGGDSVEQTITLWSTNGTVQRTLSGHTSGVTALAFSPKGDLLASGGRRFDNAVRVWRVSNGSLARTFTSLNAANVECVALAPDDNTVAYGSSVSAVLTVGKISDGTTQSLGTGVNPVFSVAFSPNGGTLAATDQNTVQIWTNGASWVLCETVTSEAVRASCLAYSPNGNLLLCGRDDGTVTMSPNTRGALSQNPLQFTSVVSTSPYSATLNAAVQPWTHYVLQSSPDLLNWSFLTLAATTNASSLTILDAAPDQSARFYRAITPP